MAMISIGIQMNMSITDKGIYFGFIVPSRWRSGALILGCFKALFVKYYLPVYVLLCGFCYDAGLGDSSGLVVYSGREYVGEFTFIYGFLGCFFHSRKRKVPWIPGEYVAGYCTDVYAGSCRGSAYAGYAVVVVWNLGSYRGDVVSRFLDGIRDMPRFLAEGDFNY